MITSLFADVPVSTQGTVGPDGLTIDSQGNLFICMPTHGAIYVVKPSGEPLAIIKTAETTRDGYMSPLVTNCIFGSTSTDRKRLYFCDSVQGRICFVDWEHEGGTPVRQSKRADV